jgi:cytoskeletal protein CcmA (bactofilin family)
LIKARSVVISGLVEGHVACDKIEILPDGKLIGDLICREFVVEPGGKFIGQRHELAEGGRVLSMPDLIDSNEHKRLLDFAGLQEQAADEEDYLVVEHRK